MTTESTASCIFCKMVAGEIKPDVVFEDDAILAFRDINPQAPVHILIIPKQHIATLNDVADCELAGRLLMTAARLAKQLGLSEDGYRTVINCNKKGGQEVYHVHVHVLGERQMTWPPG
ncbi:MAG: histidine triad nucleotide-binding protein [Methylovulum sp.]|nr:histidine triad nucleotide-binding protein [Methylovulum sp.]